MRPKRTDMKQPRRVRRGCCATDWFADSAYGPHEGNLNEPICVRQLNWVAPLG